MTFGVWTRYLAVVVFVGAALPAAWNVFLLPGAVLDNGVAAIAFNLAVAASAIGLAVMVAAPGLGRANLPTKLVAVLALLGAGVSLFSAVNLFRNVAGQSVFPSALSDVERVMLREQSVEGAFYAACTLALAVIVLFSRAGARDGTRD